MGFRSAGIDFSGRGDRRADEYFRYSHRYLRETRLWRYPVRGSRLYVFRGTQFPHRGRPKGQGYHRGGT